MVKNTIKVYWRFSLNKTNNNKESKGEIFCTFTGTVSLTVNSKLYNYVKFDQNAIKRCTKLFNYKINKNMPYKQGWGFGLRSSLTPSVHKKIIRRSTERSEHSAAGLFQYACMTFQWTTGAQGFIYLDKTVSRKSSVNPTTSRVHKKVIHTLKFLSWSKCYNIFKVSTNTEDLML